MYRVWLLGFCRRLFGGRGFISDRFEQATGAVNGMCEKGRKLNESKIAGCFDPTV